MNPRCLNGHEVPGGAPFCPTCGAPVTPPPPPYAATPQPGPASQRRPAFGRPGVVVLAAFLVVAALAGVLTFVFARSGPSPALRDASHSQVSTPATPGSGHPKTPVPAPQAVHPLLPAHHHTPPTTAPPLTTPPTTAAPPTTPPPTAPPTTVPPTTVPPTTTPPTTVPPTTVPPTTVPPTTAPPATVPPTTVPPPPPPTAAPTTAALPLLSIPGGYSGMEPSTIDFSGTDGNTATGLTWTWGPTQAVGVGHVLVDDCMPNCAEGGQTSQVVNVTLSNPENGVFTIAVEAIPSAVGDPQNTFTYPNAWLSSAS